MTGQMSDQVLYKGEAYPLVVVSGEGLFTPGDFGLNPYFTCTACWRGYLMWHKCENGELVLDGMSVSNKDPVEINGVMPTQPKELFKYMYEGLSIKTKFTGSIMIAKDFIQSMYVHMGFQSPETYRTVIRLEVQYGNITREDDLSMSMESRRKKGEFGPLAPESRKEGDVAKWIERRFSLDRILAGILTSSRTEAPMKRFFGHNDPSTIADSYCPACAVCQFPKLLSTSCSRLRIVSTSSS